jgi:hypothetical protein
MIDIESELRQGKIFALEPKMFDPNREDVEMVSYIPLGLTAGLRVEAKAKKDAEETKSGLDGIVADVAYDIELRHRLIYWAVVYGLSVEDKPAYQHIPSGQVKELGIEYMGDYIENRLGTYRGVYEDIGLEILRESGLDHLLPEIKESYDEDDHDDGDPVLSSVG